MTKNNPPLPSDSSERIYKAATNLFAHKGFEGTSIRDIAAAVGLSVSTVNYHVGGKDALYHEILRRTYVMEHQLFSPMIENVDDAVLHDVNQLRGLFKHIIDVFIKRIQDEPETYRLWTFHFLEESDLLVEMDKEFSLPFYQMILAFMKRARQAGTISGDDELLKLFIVSVSWMLHGYFNGRKNNWGDPAYDPFSDVHIQGLRDFFSLYVERMLDYSAGD
jgi:AcrR family transcriptional regulator